MKFFSFAIQRPVFSISINIMIMMVGLLSLMHLTLQHYPEVEQPILTLTTQCPGMNATIVESKVTTLLEESLGGLNGLDFMESVSNNGTSTIILNFKDGISTTEAAADVREKVAQVVSELPPQVKAPSISKDLGNQKTFMSLVLTSKSDDALAVYDYADRYLRGPIESIDGVASTFLYGNPYTMQVRIDAPQLTSHHLTLSEVIQSIQSAVDEKSLGKIIKGGRYVSITAKNTPETPGQFGEITIKEDQGAIIRLKDIAHIFLDKDTGGFEWVSRFQGKPATFIAINQASGANMLAIAQQVKKLLPDMQKSLPQHLTLEVGYDYSVFIEASLEAVKSSIFEAVILVFGIIFLFLQNWRAALIPLVTIPVSLLGACGLLYAFGFSLNTITLLAMVLAIGLVVDDAVVVLENIHRHMEEGLSPFQAALRGSQEIGFAIIAMTLVLAAAYAPVAFIKGVSGALFAEFAVTLSGAVVISGIVALTLSPMMCARLLKSHTQTENRMEIFLEAFEKKYLHALGFVMRKHKSVLGFLIGSFILIGWIFFHIPQELAPQEDQGIILSYATAAPSQTIEKMLEYTDQVEAIFKSIPEYEGVWSATDANGSSGGVTLKPWSERKRRQDEILQEIQEKFNQIPGAIAYAFPMQSLLSGGQAGVQLKMKTTGSYEDLEKTLDHMVKELEKSSIFQNVHHDLTLSSPEINVLIQREKAALAKIPLDEIEKILSTMLGGDRSMKFARQGKHYDIVVQTQDKDKLGMQSIHSFYVQTDQKDFIPLSHLISLEEITTPSLLNHFNKMRSATINADLEPGKSAGEAITFLEKTLTPLLGQNMKYEYGGTLRTFLDANHRLQIIFIASLIFIFLILAIQFESFIDPFIILLTAPISVLGALLSLYGTGNSLNIFSQIGLITLVGLMTKHGILLVDFANQVLREGESPQEAARKAGHLRLRPILMTTSAMVLGAIPLVLNNDAGAESRTQIGCVLIGGLLFGTLFTLFVIPTIYGMVKDNVK